MMCFTFFSLRKPSWDRRCESCCTESNKTNCLPGSFFIFVLKKLLQYKNNSHEKVCIILVHERGQNFVISVVSYEDNQSLNCPYYDHLQVHFLFLQSTRTHFDLKKKIFSFLMHCCSTTIHSLPKTLSFTSYLFKAYHSKKPSCLGLLVNRLQHVRNVTLQFSAPTMAPLLEVHANCSLRVGQSKPVCEHYANVYHGDRS